MTARKCESATTSRRSSDCLPQKHAWVRRVRATHKELHPGTLFVGGDSVSLELAVWRGEVMLTRQRFGPEQKRNRW
jgi:hypothetical protein